MKYLKYTILVLLLFPTVLNSQIDRTQAPKPGPAPEIRISDYKTFELKNGLKVFLVENHKIPRVSYSLLLDINPFAEGDSLGYTSIAGQLLGTATTTRSKDQIDEEIDFIGASMNTSSGSLSGSALKKHNEKLLEIMSDILLNPVFNQRNKPYPHLPTIKTIQLPSRRLSQMLFFTGRIIPMEKSLQKPP
jgi:hypothetical protein